MLKWSFLLAFVLLMRCMAHVTFTNIKCNFMDETFGEFRNCYIKAVNRSHKYLSIYAALYQLPIEEIMVNIRLTRYSNGYKPFYIDMTIDVCPFLKKPKNPFVLMYFNTFKAASNINHTCPYDHDIILDKFYTGDHETEFTRFLPIPNGDYVIHTTFIVKKRESSKVSVYLRVTSK